MKRVFCLVAFAMCCGGCTLQDVIERGQTCPPNDSEYDADLGLIGNTECKNRKCDPNSDADYSENIKYGFCPIEYPECGYDVAKNRYYCAKIACEANKHIYDNECEKNTTKNCGSHGNNCKKLAGWVSGVCEDARCIANECDTNYILEDGVCVAHSTSCEEGDHYYIEGGTCENNTIANCGSHGNDCEKLSGWNNGVCSTEGKCIALSCTTGYALDEDNRCVARTECPEGEHMFAGECEPDSVDNCGNHGVSCENLSGWVAGGCVAGACVASECETGYELKGSKCEALIECAGDEHLYLGVCEPNDLENCGKHGFACQSVAGWGDGECVDSECMPSACDTGYELKDGRCEALTECAGDEHLYAGSCEPNDPWNCGTHGFSCESMAGWAGGACISGACVPDSCMSGYILEGNKCVALTECPAGQHIDSSGSACEADSVYNCGKPGYACADTVPGWSSGKCSNAECVPTQCQYGYCLDNYNQCVIGQADKLACGVNGGKCVTCSGSKICSAGACQVSTCDQGQHIYNGACEADSTANCGSHGNACNVAHAMTNKCNSGVCQAASCQDGYHIYNGTCEASDLTNCGWHGHTCSIDNSSKMECSGSTCKPAECKSLYHIYGNKCEKNDNDNCGAHDKKCTTANLSYSNSVSCLTGTCKATSCDTTKAHLYEGKCEYNSTSNCGYHGNTCSKDKISNSATVVCTDGKCQAKTCASNYHVYSGACELNSNTNCNAHGVACTTSKVTNSSNVSCLTGTCKATACKTGYHTYEGKCEANTDSNCNGHGVACTTGKVSHSQTVACSSTGTCEAKTCKDYAVLSSGKCTKKCSDTTKTYCSGFGLGNGKCCTGCLMGTGCVASL